MIATITRPPLMTSTAICTSNDPTNHQGATCPVHEAECLSGHILVADSGNVTVFMLVSEPDSLSFDNLPSGQSRRSAWITNLLTGQRLRVSRGPCGLGCYCAAKVVAA